MQKFAYKFDSLPYTDENIKRVKEVLAVHAPSANYSFERADSGCIVAYLYLRDMMHFMSMELTFRNAGLRS
jgi:hypothetical protein